MPITVYKQLVAQDNKKTLRSMNGNELDMNSIRENMFLISKDTKIVYFVTTHFKSFSRKLHFINIFTGKKRGLTYEITLFKVLDEAIMAKQKAKSRKAERARKVFIKSHDLVKDTILLPLLEAKIKRNKVKRQTKIVVARRKELDKALIFVKAKIAIRKLEKKKRIPSYGEDD